MADRHKEPTSQSDKRRILETERWDELRIYIKYLLHRRGKDIPISLEEKR